MSLRRRTVGIALVLCSAGLLAPGMAVADKAPAIHRGQMVPQKPKVGGAQIMDGFIRSADHVGSKIIVGGTFTTIKLPDGTSVNQPYLAAFDANTMAFDPSFRPAVNGEVMAVEAGETSAYVFIGGRFSTVGGVAHQKLAKLTISNGAPVATWKTGANAVVKTLDRFGDRLFVGGSFTSLGGQAHSMIGEVSASRGAANAAFTVGVTGSRATGVRPDGFFYTYTGPVVRAVRVTPDGRRLVVMHRGDLVGGQQRWGAAILDISGASPVVTPWRTRLWDPGFGQATDFVGTLEGDLSPDGTFFAMTLGVGNFPPLHDTVVAFPVTGNDGVSPLWVTQNFDSTYGVAISDAAVYVGGHFCWTESQWSTPSPMYWPGRSGNEYSCTSISGSVFQPYTTARYHLAALDRTTGRAIDAWTAKSNNSRNGVQFLRAIDRGLLLGHDGTRAGDLTVGRFGFFDLGPTFNA